MLDYITYFRAVAIIFIVAGHTLCWGHSTMKDFNTLLFAGGTYFFVFIAGFLFQYLAYKFDIKKYFKKKFLNVICPYFFTLLPCALPYTLSNTDNWFFTSSPVLTRFFAVTLGGYIVNGPVWFVGMIAVMFLFSPLFLYLKKYKKIYITMFLMSFILCLIVPRYSSVNTYLELHLNFQTNAIAKILYVNFVVYFRSFLHFCFIYLLGMLTCEIITKNVMNIKENLKTIFYISLFLYVFHFVVHLFIIKPTYNMRYMELISKLIETFVLLSGIMLLEQKIKQYKILDKSLKFVADYSFGIFFVHGMVINYIWWSTPYLVRGLKNTTSFFIINKNTSRYLFNSIEIFLIVLIGSILLLLILKFILKLFGVKNTRIFIGV